MGNRLKPDKGLTQILADLESLKVGLRVAPPSSTGNETINQLIGNRDDNRNSETIYAALHDIWKGKHHGQKLYPNLAAAVTVTTHVDDWTLGNFAEIVPANTIAEEFHIHHLHISAPDANADYILVLYNGTTELMRVSFSVTDKKSAIGGLDVVVPYCSANSQIQAKLANSRNGNADSVDVRLWYYER